MKKGITLISLVITIIILIILATVAINLAVDSNGLFRRAGDAANIWNNSVAQEGQTISDLLSIADELTTIELKPMVTKWNIAEGDTVKLYLYSPQDMEGNALEDNTDVTIDWGDGTVEHYTSSTLTNGVASHTYTVANSDTTITISGKCNCIVVPEDAKLTAIEQWGYTETSWYCFMSCTNLVSIASPEKYTFKNVKSFYVAFAGCTSLASIPENMFKDCSNATSFRGTFYACMGLTEIGDYAFANCSNATSFEGTFYACIGLTSIPDNLFTNCSNATSFEGTFYACMGLTEIGDYAFANCSNATSFEGTFMGCTSLTSLPEDLFANCSNVTSFSDTFEGCTGLTSIPEDLFANCSNVTDFTRTFQRCTGLTSIPDNLFANCSNVTSFLHTFSECTGLTGNAIPLWERVTEDTTTYKGTPNGADCYYNCTGLTNYDEIPEYWK